METGEARDEGRRQGSGLSQASTETEAGARERQSKEEQSK